LKEGYSAKQFIKQLTDDLIVTKEFNNLQKSRILLEIGELEKNLLDGSDEYLQMVSLGGVMIRNLE
jgi:replication factor C subunit 2/4